MKAHAKRAATLLGTATLTILALIPANVIAQGDAPVEIAAPADGDTLTGVVEIRGTISAPNFLAANLAFAYDAVNPDQWFDLAEIAGPVSNSRLALWDTVTISDGAYLLRLRRRATDGTVQDQVIRIQVRNYTSVPTPFPSETPTAQPTVKIPTPIVILETPTPIRVVAPTPTEFPVNPASLTRQDLLGGLARGGFAVMAVFLLWGAITMRRRT